MQKIKLSDKQKEVIRLMRYGWEVFVFINEVKGKKGQTVYKSRQYTLCFSIRTMYLHHSTILSLKAKGILQRLKPFGLTELGKTIDIS